MNPRRRKTRRLGPELIASIALALCAPFLVATQCQNATSAQVAQENSTTAAQQLAMLQQQQANLADAQAKKDAAAQAAAQANIDKIHQLQADNAAVKQQLADATKPPPAAGPVQTAAAAFPPWGDIAASVIGLGIVAWQQLRVNKAKQSADTNQANTDALGKVLNDVQNHPNPVVATAATALVREADLPLPAKAAIAAHSTT